SSGNHSLSFDGVDDYVELTDMDLLQNFTLMSWVYNTDFSSPNNIISKLNNPGGYALLISAGNGLIYGHTKITSESDGVCVSNTVIPLNQWTHISMTFNNGNLSFYVNGDSVYNCDGIANASDNSDKVFIGKASRFADDYIDPEFFNGSLDDISIWDVALTESQIQSFMTTSPTGSESGLVGYWNFNEGTGSTLTDQTSNGNDGTINGGATWSTDTPDPATYYVATDGSDNNDGSSSSPFATIQKGINIASNGDTVLVAAGTYVENINYNGKNIVVGSLYLTTSDTSYISSTIIDGNQDG
ncbi:uncharacterized protein METZ01_LOCUS378110, partial [marine metagenome]